MKVGEGPIPAKAAAPTLAAGRLWVRSPMRSSRRSRPPAPAGSSSSMRTSTSRELLDNAAKRWRAGSASPARRRDRAAEAGGAPTAASTGRRIQTRFSNDAATPPGCARRSCRGRGRSTSAPGRAVRRPRERPRPRRTGGGATGHTHPWRVTRQVAAPIEEPHVGLIIDTSGSMAGYEYALGPIAWILTDGLRQIAGGCATALSGNSTRCRRRQKPLALVPVSAPAATAFAGDAVELVSGQLKITNPRRPRFVYVLSDGGWSDTRAGVERIRELSELGVPTIHLSIGIARAAQVRPHHRDHRSRPGARPHRRGYRRRAPRPPGLTAERHHTISSRKDAACPHPRIRALTPRPCRST